MSSHYSSSLITRISSAKLKAIRRRLVILYGLENADHLLERLYLMIGRYGVGVEGVRKPKGLSQRDAVLITYADMVSNSDESPLVSLREFCIARLKGAISTIHLLPFYPWTSDDGFSVVDYRKVDERNGNWEDISRMSEEFELMFDLVLNHCSSQSPWFKEYVSGIEPGKNYIMEGDDEVDLSAVVRPRSSPLLTQYQTRAGERHVWTTFSADQVDLDWTCPDLLFEFLDIILFYVSCGCRVLRLDAVAFLWKKLGTNCLHLPETHQVIKLIRNFLEIVAPEVLILTETNVPHEENVSYFGKGDEAHAVYQFSLPPLLLHGLLRGTAQHLSEWAQNLAPPPKGCHFLNFTASHDGIGVRPLEGILPNKEILGLAEEVRQKGGFVSMRKLENGDEVIEEMEGKIRELCEQYSLETDTQVELEVVAQRQNCGIPFTHPLVKTTRAIMAESGITPKVDPSTGDLNVLIRAGQPGVTLGLSTAENLREDNETIHLEPLYAGMAQLITLLQAIDQELCES